MNIEEKMELADKASRVHDLLIFSRTVARDLYKLFEYNTPRELEYISRYETYQAYSNMLLEFLFEALPLVESLYTEPLNSQE